MLIPQELHCNHFFGEANYLEIVCDTFFQYNSATVTAWKNRYPAVLPGCLGYPRRASRVTAGTFSGRVPEYPGEYVGGS